MSTLTSTLERPAEAKVGRVHSAHVVVPPGGKPRLLTDPHAHPVLRSASVLKPLLMWAASTLPPFEFNLARWASLAGPAVTRSENAPMVEVWDACGPAALLGALTHLTGSCWACEPGGESFGRVLIRADRTALAYGALAAAADTDRVAAQLLAWMRAVPARQTFGVRDAAATILGVDPDAVGVKCGWFAAPDETVIRTHAVTIAAGLSGVTHVSCVLSAVDLNASARALYQAAYTDGHEVLGIHQDIAADLLAETTTTVLA